MKNGDVLEEPHIEKATQAKFGAPEPAMDRPTGARQRVGSPAPAHFHDTNFVAFFHQAMSRHAATEAGTDHDEIEIKLVVPVLIILVLVILVAIAGQHKVPLSLQHGNSFLCRLPSRLDIEGAVMGKAGREIQENWGVGKRIGY